MGRKKIWSRCHSCDFAATSRSEMTKHFNLEHRVYPSTFTKGRGAERKRREEETDGGAEVIETVNHPKHYGGDTVYEVIKVLEAWDLGHAGGTAGFNLGNAIKYIARSGRKGEYLSDLKKAAWYLNREIENQGRK